MSTSFQLERAAFPSEVQVPSLRANFTWTFASNITYALCQWGMLSILAKLGSPAIVGQFALGLAISAPVFMFTNLQLRAVQATDARSEHAFANYFTLRLIATVIGFLAICLLVTLVGYDERTRIVILGVSVAKSVECLSDAVAGLFQKEERLDRVAVSLTVRGLLSVLVFGLVFAEFQSLALSVAGMAATWFSILLLIDLRWAREMLEHGDRFLMFEWRNLKTLLVLSLPLGLVMTLASLTVNIPRYFLQHYRGSTELGIFASLAYLVVAVNLIVYALGQSATARLSRMFANGEGNQFRGLIRKLVAFGISIIVLGVPFTILFGRPVLTIVYRREYADHVLLLVILVIAAGINAVATFITCGLNAARTFRSQVPVNVLTAVAATVACFVLIPRSGLNGAACAILVSSLVSLAGASYVFWRYTEL